MKAQVVERKPLAQLLAAHILQTGLKRTLKEGALDIRGELN